MSDAIDHSYTNEIVCPYCGYVHTDSWEWLDGKEGDDEFECGECSKLFNCSRYVTVKYSTFPRKDDL